MRFNKGVWCRKAIRPIQYIESAIIEKSNYESYLTIVSWQDMMDMRLKTRKEAGEFTPGNPTYICYSPASNTVEIFPPADRRTEIKIQFTPPPEIQ